MQQKYKSRCSLHGVTFIYLQQASKQSSTLCARLLLLRTVCYNTLKQRLIHFLKHTVNISVAKRVYSEKIPESRKTNMPPRTRTCEPPPYRSHRQPHPKSGHEADQSSRKHSSKKRSSNSESGPRSKKSRPEDHEQSSTRRKRSTSSRPSESTSQEPPTAKQRQQKAPVNHATLSENEIKKWLILITDENLSRRKRREHALHFLGAADSTLVTLQYRTLSLPRQKPVGRTSKATIPSSWVCKRYVPLANQLPYMNNRLYIISSELANAPGMAPTHTDNFSCMYYTFISFLRAIACPLKL